MYLSYFSLFLLLYYFTGPGVGEMAQLLRALADLPKHWQEVLEDLKPQHGLLKRSFTVAWGGMKGTSTIVVLLGK